MNAFAAGSTPSLTEEEVFELGIEAWIYLLPLVLMELTRRVMTNVTSADSLQMRAPAGEFAHASVYPDASFKDVVRPNADTLYSMLWFDVGTEPLILSLPETPRYHVLPLMDMWTDVFAALGTCSTGGSGGDCAIVGSRWRGTLPTGVRAVTSPTDAGWLLGRIQTNGPSDFDEVRGIQARMRATSLSSWQQSARPARTRIDPAIDMATPPVAQAMAMTAEDFFGLAAALMKRHVPHATDWTMVARLERLGLYVGADYVLSEAPSAVRRALGRAISAAKQRMSDRGMARRQHRDGWVLPSVLGVYGNEYLSRAFTAFRGLGALPESEALYPTALSDGEGRALDGKHRYKLHFGRDALPPVRAFWSLTMYGADHFFVANPINRFAVGDRDALSFNVDDSLDLFIQHEEPADPKERANWLPAPTGSFSMNLRLYRPRAEALDGRWNAPPIERLS